MSVTVPVAMFGWIPLVIATFALLQPRRAVLVAYLGGWLFLPMATYDLPAIPAYTKATATALGVMLGVGIFDAGRLASVRLRLLDLPVIAFCLSPVAASLSNGLGIYDGLSTALTQTLTWGVPYLLGRMYFADGAGARDLALAVFIAGLVYMPLCLWEVRMSPRLHQVVYGFRQHSMSQAIRFGGWRPMVFMQHGIAVGLFMATAALSGLWLWRSAAVTRLRQLPMPLLVLPLCVTVVLCKSLLAIVLLAGGLGVLMTSRRLRLRVALAALVLAAPAYIGLRTVGGWSASEVSDAVAVISEERAGSLQTRLDSEVMLFDHAMQRPFFGWGGMGPQPHRGQARAQDRAARRDVGHHRRPVRPPRARIPARDDAPSGAPRGPPMAGDVLGTARPGSGARPRRDRRHVHVRQPLQRHAQPGLRAGGRRPRGYRAAPRPSGTAASRRRADHGPGRGPPFMIAPVSTSVSRASTASDPAFRAGSSDRGAVPDYIFLVGHGGSGTKRVFHLLDLSPLTHCRMANEAASNSPFAELPSGRVPAPELDSALEAGWDDAVAWAATHLSRSDRLPPPRKAHLHDWARRLGLWRLVRSPRGRRLGALLAPGVSHDEWALPWWLGRATQMQSARLVLKQNKVPTWAAWVLAHRPTVAVIHVVRHPGGYLNAWRGRYFDSAADPAAVTADNRARLAAIGAADAAWAARWGDPAALSAVEAELWFWRYCTETVHAAAGPDARYRLVLDEDVVADPEGAARAIHEVAGVPLDPPVLAWIADRRADWTTRTAPWRDLHDPAGIAAVERVLDGSPLRSWWPDDARVSLFDYVAYRIGG